MARYDAQINILLSGQRRLEELTNQLYQIEDSITRIQRGWQAASANLNRATRVANVFGRSQPQGEGGRFAPDPDRRERWAALAAERRARTNARLLRLELGLAERRAMAARQEIESGNRLIQQAERRVTLESRLNTAVTRFERRSQAFARGGGGAGLPQGLQDQARSLEQAFRAAGGANARNLSLVRSLAAEYGALVERQNEFNRNLALSSKGFEAGRRLQERVDAIAGQGVVSSQRIQGLRSGATEVIAASRRGDQQAYSEALRRATAAISRVEKESNEVVRETRRIARLAPRSPVRGGINFPGSPRALEEQRRMQERALLAAQKGYPSSPIMGTATMQGSPRFLAAQERARAASEKALQAQERAAKVAEKAANREAERILKESQRGYPSSPILGSPSMIGSPRYLAAQERLKKALEREVDRSLSEAKKGYPSSPILGAATVAGSPRWKTAQEAARAKLEKAASAAERAADRALKEAQKGYPSSPILGTASIAGSPRYLAAQEKARAAAERVMRAQERAAKAAQSEAERALSQSQKGYPASPILGSASMVGSPRFLAAQERAAAIAERRRKAQESAAERAARKQERAAAAAERAADRALAEAQKGFPSSPILGSASMTGSPRFLAAQERARAAAERAANAVQRAADKALSEAQKGFPSSPILGSASMVGSPRWIKAQEAANKKLEQAAKATERAADKALQDATKGFPSSPIRGGVNLPGSPIFKETPFLERQFGKRGSAAISEGLVGGAFPLLFGQGVASAAFGGLGGALGGLAGGGLGFGLSLLGTALGSVVDQLNQAAQETGKSLNRPIESFEKLKEAGLFASRQQEQHIATLIEFGLTTEATAEIQAEMIRKIGVSGVNDLMRLGDASSDLSKAWAEFNLQLQAALAGPMAGLLRWVTGIVSVWNTRNREAATIQDVRAGLSGADLRAFDKERRELMDRVRGLRITSDDAAKEELAIAKRYAGRAGVAAAKPKESSEDLLLQTRRQGASQLLSAIDTRAKAIEDARKQREEQIAEIRKRSIEQAAQIERSLADRRRDIEREIADIRLRRADEAEDIQRRIRIARGEDPELVQAEQEIADIYRRGRDERAELEQRLADDERNQAREIADFQKGVADELRNANEAHNKRMGEIQRDYARASAKIIEEGSGRAGKRLTDAYNLLILRLDRDSLNQQRIAVGVDPIPVPTMTGGRLLYPDIPKEKLKDVVSPRFQQLDEQMLELERKLQSMRQAGIGEQLASISGGGATNNTIGNQFISLLEKEGGFEDVAGLQPLPLQKMLRQIGRPFTRLYRQIEEASGQIYSYSRGEINRMLAPNPARTQTVLQRAQKVESVRRSWSPEEVQWKERENRWRENPRSRPSQASFETFVGVTRGISARKFQELNKIPGTIYGILDDLSDYLNPKELETLRRGIREQLEQGVDPLKIKSWAVGGNVNTGRANIRKAIRNLTNEISATMRRGPVNQLRVNQLRTGGMGAVAPSTPRVMEEMLEQQMDDQMRLHKRLLELGEPPRISPGFDIEGAMLPSGRSFDVSKLGTDLGTIATASFMRGILSDRQLAQAQPIQTIPFSQQTTINTPGLRGEAGRTTQAREELRRVGISASRATELDQINASLAEVNLGAAQYSNNLEKQLSLLDQQIRLISKGRTPEQARALGEVETEYQNAKLRLEYKIAEARKKAGLSEEEINYLRENGLGLLKETYDENTRLILQYQDQLLLLEAASVRRQLDLVGVGASKGLFGAPSRAYESALAAGGTEGTAMLLAQQTRNLEIKQSVAGVNEELNAILDPANQVIAVADRIGGAFSDSFKGVISGSMTAQEALAGFFQSVADHFLDMAAQIIAKWITMTILNSVLKLFPGGGGIPGAPAGQMNSAGFDWGVVDLLNAKGNVFGSPSLERFANGGMFTNSIVSSPTLFKFADGGAMSTGLMGEAGPEAIMPLRRGPGGRLGVDASGGGGDVSVTVNVDARGTAVEGNDRQGAALGRAISVAVQAEIVKQKRPGGLLTK